MKWLLTSAGLFTALMGIYLLAASTQAEPAVRIALDQWPWVALLAVVMNLIAADESGFPEADGRMHV